jgi:hypothetical protein
MSEKITLNEIRNLIERFQQHVISTQEFCASFERIWNFEFKKNSLSNEICARLDFLFDEVVLFCPLPREQWEYPKYRDEAEIRAAATKALLSIAF